MPICPSSIELNPYLYTQLRHSGRDCRNPGYRDVSGLPSLALDTRFPAGMMAFVNKGMGLTQHSTIGVLGYG
ncbi:MAG: hypothetical protein ACXWT1_15960 [Methylobacter sp.]